jgi:predicted membrane channel-forming protein YqfA (hemolysin III family)
MRDKGAGPAGIGGWLAALLVVTGVIAPLFYGYLIWFALDAQATLRRFGAEGLPLWSHLTAMWMLGIAKIAIAWSIVGAMLRYRTPVTIRFAIAGIWLLSVGATFADCLWLEWVPPDVPLWRIAAVLGEGLLLAIPATLYLLRSKRVRNTYNPAAALRAVEAVFE